MFLELLSLADALLQGVDAVEYGSFDLCSPHPSFQTVRCYLRVLLCAAIQIYSLRACHAQREGVTRMKEQPSDRGSMICRFHFVGKRMWVPVVECNEAALEYGRLC